MGMFDYVDFGEDGPLTALARGKHGKRPQRGRGRCVALGVWAAAGTASEC